MSDWFTLGSAALGAASSLFGGDGEEPRGAFAKKATRGALKGAIEIGKKYGFHPLWLMGSPATSAGGSYVGSATGSGTQDALNAAAEGVRQIGNARAHRIQQAKENVRADRITDAQVDKARAEALASRAQANRDYVESAYTASRLGTLSRDVNSQPTAQNPEMLQKYIQVFNPFTKKKEWVPNPEIYELPEAVGAAMYGRAGLQDVAEPEKSRRTPTGKRPASGRPVHPNRR